MAASRTEVGKLRRARAGGTQAGMPVLQGKREGDAGTAAQFAVDPEGAAVEGGDALDDGQAQPDASGVLRAGAVHAMEAVADARQVSGGNPTTGV